MTIYIKDVFDSEFVKEFIPKIITARVGWLVKRKNLNKMNKFLKAQYGITVDDIVANLRFSVNKVAKAYSISVNNNIKEPKSQEKIISLVKLLDYGNLEIKGQDIVHSSMLYVNANLNAIYKAYMLKGGK